MAAQGLLLASLLLLSCVAETSYGMVLLSSLQRTLVVSTSQRDGILKAGEDKITVAWGLNQSFSSGVDSAYKTIKVQLCYAPISQVDRAWRKTVDNLEKDKTCQFKIHSGEYKKGNQTIEWTIERDAPGATYFVRAYALNAEKKQVAYGQSTDAQKKTNLFQVQAITGRHASLDIASIVFSAFSVVSLFGFFILEKRKAKRSSSN